ncbi:MAG: nucleotide synthetase [Pacificimonas sp.]
MNREPGHLVYLCLVPDGSSDRFALRYHEARVAVEGDCANGFDLASRPEAEPVKGEPVDFDIRKNSYVVIELFEKFEWRYSQEFAGVVLKNKADRKFYGKLEYAESLAGPYHPKSDFPPGKAIRFLRFAAKFNKLPDGEGAKHPYCLNMEFRMNGAETWIPMSLDPDINNPPPDHGHN